MFCLSLLATDKISSGKSKFKLKFSFLFAPSHKFRQLHDVCLANKHHFYVLQKKFYEQ